MPMRFQLDESCSLCQIIKHSTPRASSSFRQQLLIRSSFSKAASDFHVVGQICALAPPMASSRATFLFIRSKLADLAVGVHARLCIGGSAGGPGAAVLPISKSALAFASPISDRDCAGPDFRFPPGFLVFNCCASWCSGRGSFPPGAAPRGARSSYFLSTASSALRIHSWIFSSFSTFFFFRADAGRQ